MSKAKKPEAIRLAEYLQSHYDLFPGCDQLLAAEELLTQHARIDDIEATHLRELAAYRTTVENLKTELVQEAARTAAEKLRADLMSQQHDTQAALNREAREQLATLKAAPAAQAVEPQELVPGMTAEEVNALPEKARNFIHDLETNADPSNMVRENIQLKDVNNGLQAMYRGASNALAEVIRCFRAAEIEGLHSALAETADAHLKDLVERRLMYALHAAEEVSANPAPAAVAVPVPPLTPDEARQAARTARMMSGPSDATQPTEYAMAGALALAAKLAATPPAQAQSDDLEALRDMLDSARTDLDMLREALRVPVEPHQSLAERMLEAAQAQYVQLDAGLIEFIEAHGDVRFSRCREGSINGPIRWDVEYGYHDDEVRAPTLAEAIRAAIAASAAQEGGV